MKRYLTILFCGMLLTGCQNSDKELNRVLLLRESIFNSDCCVFDAVITADYGDCLYVFQMQCHTDGNDGLNFTVTYPDSIAGISGYIDQETAHVTFDNNILAFEKMADDYISPVSAPWVFVKALRSGYIRACEPDGEITRVIVDDSYEDDALQLSIWLDENDTPNRAEILWGGRRILSLDIINFSCL